MKSLLTLIAISMFSASAFAKPLLKRELFNARNGESFTCVVHEDGKVVLSSDNGNSGEKSKKVSIPSDDLAKWIKELKADSKYKKVKANKRGIESVEPELTTQYVQRGMKKYSVRDGAKDVGFYALKGYIPANKKKSDKPGSLHYKLKNYQQLKGAVDLACKMAM